MLKILVIDDEKSIVNLIKMNLILEGYEVFTAYNGIDAVKSFKENNPDIILLDIMLPDIDGYEVMKQIQKIDNNKPIILITAKNQLNSRLLGLQLGADDYITKPFDNRELILRIQAIWRRINRCKINMLNDNKDVQTDNVLKYDAIEILKKERKVFINKIEIKLTYKEFDTLLIMTKNYGKVFTREELLEHVWQYDYEGNSRAVDILIRRLRKKMGQYGEFIQTIYGVGYKIEVKKDEAEYKE